MSVRSDVINLTVNVNGNESLNKLNDLRKKAADANFELKGLKKNTEEFAKKKTELEGYKTEMDNLKKQIGITALTMRELRQEQKALSAMRDSVSPLTEEWKKYDAQLQKVNSRMKEVGTATQGAAKHTSMMGDVAKGIGIAAVFDKALSAVTNFFRGSIEEAEHAEKVASRLRNNLDNLGEVDAFDRLSEKADQLAARFKFIDNDDVVEVFNQLITYGKLTEKQMDELLPVITDFAAKSGMSMSESTSVVIKALEGNSKALKEYGIDMKDGANVTERMSILMKELKPRVEGAADAFGNTLAGQTSIAKQQMNDIKEEVGKNLIPALQTFYNAINVILQRFNELVKLGGNIIKYGASGGLAAAFAESDAEEIAERNKKAAQSMLLRTKNMDIAGKEKYLQNLESSVTKKEEELADARARKDYAAVKNINETINSFRIARDMLKNELNPGNKVLGIGADDINEDKKYDQLLEKAKSFAEKLNDLKHEAEQASKSNDQKEIDAAVRKYNSILKEYDDLVKKLNTKDRSLLGPRAAIVEAQEKELSAIREKQRLAAFEKEQKETHDNLSKSYAEQLQENERFYEEKKSIEAKRFIAQEIDKKTLDANLAHIDLDAKNAQLVIAETYSSKTVTIEGKIVPAVEQSVRDITRIKKEALETQTKDALAAFDKQQAELKLREELGKRAAEAKITTRLIVAKGSGDFDGQLKAQKELNEFQRQMKLVALDKEKHDALQAITDTGIARIEKENEILNAIAEQKRAVNAETDAADEEIANTVHQNKLARVAEIGQATMAMFSSINQFITNIENRQLQQELARNEKKRKDIKKQLDSKLLSQEQYSKAVQAIDEEEEKHKKQIARDQAKREKALNLMSAVMTTALAIIGFLTAKPIGPWNFVEAAIAGALGGAQIGVIASTPLPSLGTGGLIKEGPYHKDPQKGLHVVDPSTGKTQMLLERDEGVLKGSAMRSNETFTVTGTPSQIASGLNSMYGGVNWEGGALITNMRSMKPAQINPNMPRIMEMGGVVRSSSSPAGNGSGLSEELLKQMIAEQRMTREALKEFNTELSATVSLKQFKDTEKLYDAAKKSSAINQN
jgi:hypothetical protein